MNTRSHVQWRVWGLCGRPPAKCRHARATHALKPPTVSRQHPHGRIGSGTGSQVHMCVCGVCGVQPYRRSLCTGGYQPEFSAHWNQGVCLGLGTTGRLATRRVNQHPATPRLVTSSVTRLAQLPVTSRAGNRCRTHVMYTTLRYVGRMPDSAAEPWRAMRLIGALRAPSTTSHTHAQARKRIAHHPWCTASGSDDGTAGYTPATRMLGASAPRHTARMRGLASCRAVRANRNGFIEMASYSL